MDSKPTQEQITKVWEWCGFHSLEWENLPGHYYWRDPDGHIYEAGEVLPPIDLNNLFKWVVPRLGRVKLYHVSHHLDYRAEVAIEDSRSGDTIGAANQLHPDPALAVFWAIWAAINQED